METVGSFLIIYCYKEMQMICKMFQDRVVSVVVFVLDAVTGIIKDALKCVFIWTRRDTAVGLDVCEKVTS